MSFVGENLPIAGFPEEYANLTKEGPPVANMRSMLGWLINAFEMASVGSSTNPIISGGAPALTAASKTILAA